MSEVIELGTRPVLTCWTGEEMTVSVVSMSRRKAGTAKWSYPHISRVDEDDIWPTWAIR